MSDEQQQGGEVARADAPARALRIYTPVENVQGIMDTARFEHLGRVAQVMARAGLMPQTLTHYKAPGASDNDALVPHEYEVVVARAYLIANQAELWKADPMAVAQCTSLVHGKLMFEGKLVHAIVSARLGIDLIYEFGVYDVAARDIKGTLTFGEHGERIWVGEMPTSPDDQSLGVRVLGTLPGEHAPRWIAGSVGMWNKGAKSPWGTATAWPRQLRYMGAREWTRANKPSLLLGIITDDEVEEYELARQVGAVLPAMAPALTAEFDGPAAAPAAEKPERKARAPKAKPETPKDDAPAADAAVSEPAAEAEDEVVDDGEKHQDAIIDDNVHAGAAPAGIRYLLSSDEPNEQGMTFLYQDGEVFSQVRAETAIKNNPTYDTHPEVAEPINDGPAADDAVDQDEVVQPAAEGEEQEEPLPPELKAYADKVESAATFVEVKTAMADFYGSAFFKALDLGQQNDVRANTWDAVNEATYADKPDPALDVSAFRLWIEWIDDADAITGTLAALEDQPGFAGKSDEFKSGIRAAAQARIAQLNND